MQTPALTQFLNVASAVLPVFYERMSRQAGLSSELRRRFEIIESWMLTYIGIFEQDELSRCGTRTAARNNIFGKEVDVKT